MKRVTAMILMIVLCVAVHSTQSQADVDLGTRSGWKITYLEGENNACAAAGIFDGDTTFEVFLVGKNRIWAIGVTNPSWKSVKEGKEYRTEFVFDGRRGWTGVATGTKTGIFSIDVKDRFFDEVARSRTLEIKADGKRLDRISLKGTRSAISAVVECHNDRIANSDPFADSSEPLPKQKSDSALNTQQLEAILGEVGSEIDWFKSKYGPAKWANDDGSVVRSGYDINGCFVQVTSAKGKVVRIGIGIEVGKCDVRYGDTLVSQLTFKHFLVPGSDGQWQTDCLDCGNSHDPVMSYVVKGKHAQGYVDLEITTYDVGPARDALKNQAGQEALRSMDADLSRYDDVFRKTLGDARISDYALGTGLWR